MLLQIVFYCSPTTDKMWWSVRMCLRRRRFMPGSSWTTKTTSCSTDWPIIFERKRPRKPGRKWRRTLPTKIKGTFLRSRPRSKVLFYVADHDQRYCFTLPTKIKGTVLRCRPRSKVLFYVADHDQRYCFTLPTKIRGIFYVTDQDQKYFFTLQTKIKAFFKISGNTKELFL